MAEQVPEAWIGHDVTIVFGPEGTRNVGVLRAVNDRGVVVEITPEGEETRELWYPHNSIVQMMKGRPSKLRGAEAQSF